MQGQLVELQMTVICYKFVNIIDKEDKHIIQIINQITRYKCSVQIVFILMERKAKLILKMQYHLNQLHNSLPQEFNYQIQDQQLMELLNQDKQSQEIHSFYKKTAIISSQIPYVQIFNTINNQSQDIETIKKSTIMQELGQQLSDKVHKISYTQNQVKWLVQY
ncbi:hypothetical protein pb186bvf_000919 [Paramecium bursaria]